MSALNYFKTQENYPEDEFRRLMIEELKDMKHAREKDAQRIQELIDVCHKKRSIDASQKKK